MSTNPTTTSRRARRFTLAAGVLAGAALLAACGSSSSTTATTSAPSTTNAPATTAPASSSGGLTKLSSELNKSTNSTYSATYTIASSNQATQTVTFAQAPPKAAITTSQGSFFENGTTVIYCTGTTAAANCTSLPSSMTGSLTSVTKLFSPKFLSKVINDLQTKAISSVDGINIKTSTATYAGLASDCITVSDAANPSPVTYCASKTTGLLTFASTTSGTVTLTAYSTNPLASVFSPPAGATIDTVPAGA